MQRVTLAVKIRSQLAIGYPSSDGHRTRLPVQSHLVEMGQRDLVFGAVGDPIEGVAGAQRSYLCVRLTTCCTSSTV